MLKLGAITSPKEKLPIFFSAVKAKGSENVVFGWMEWPSKEVRDQRVKKMNEDPRMKNMQMPFDGQRLIYGGFETLLDE